MCRFDFNQWLPSETRLCCQYGGWNLPASYSSPSPGSGSDDYLRNEAEKTRSSTDFTAQMTSLAETLQAHPDTTLLTVDSLWREAWVNPLTYTNAIDPDDDIKDPATLLIHMNAGSRKKFLLQYLKERFPKAAVDGNPHFLTITNSPPAHLAQADAIKAIATFMAMGVEMLNAQPRGVAVAPIAGTAFTSDAELMKATKVELMNLYRKRGRYTPK